MSKQSPSQSLLEDSNKTNSIISARQIFLSGKVQGVGFRPYIFRLATAHNLHGWVRNCVGVVEVNIQGLPANLDEFINDIFDKAPPLAEPVIDSIVETEISEYIDFSILPSVTQGVAHISVPTDLFLCDECLDELNNPSDRRYRYPFINCTQCGPRYTLIRSLPYDRPNTTMASFNLCPACLAEYNDVSNRRFHAEPVACPVCGPSLTFRHDGIEHNENESSLKAAVDTLRNGKVLAVKGIGGYHLMCDASNTAAVARLRDKKFRPHKPLAVMFPAALDEPFKYTELCFVLSDKEKSILIQASRPILLIEKNKTSALAEQIAPALNETGVMLPYSPLHHLLLNDFAGPLVATSANISGEPVLTDSKDIEKRLSHVADAFLHHNRAIERPADDSVYRVIAEKPRPIRIGRGAAPLELVLPFELTCPVIAVGAQMKNVITLAWKNRAIISPHIGEMNSPRSLEVFANTIDDLQKLYAVSAKLIICDAHPGYTTTNWAKKQPLPLHKVYHHHAHASAAYYECNTDQTVIAFTWDGVGYGEDGGLWGGETLLGKAGDWQRVVRMRPFHLPGGDKAGREPWRSAAALCWETGQAYDDSPETDPLLKQAWEQKMNCPQSTSVGRLFDAAAALTGVCTKASFEGQGPMEFEAQCNSSSEKIHHYIKLDLDNSNHLLQTNWQPLVNAMIDTSMSIRSRAILFHASLAHAILQQAKTLRDIHHVSRVCLCGGVFQNRILTEHAMALLTENNFIVSLPEIIPVNDAGISFGQVMEYGLKNN